MKVLLINGSPKSNGCTYTALAEIADTLKNDGVESEIVHLGNGAVRDCIACGACVKLGKCVFDDDPINEIVEKAKMCDGFIVGTPVYYAHPNGRILSALDRMFYSGKSAFTHKPAAAVASARRAGTTATLDVINKHFLFNQMPVVSSTYWNMVHGSVPEDVKQDSEGIQTLHNLAHNMAWLLKCIKLGKENGINIPDAESGNKTNFIR